jgi:hypothetical protein
MSMNQRVAWLALPTSLALSVLAVAPTAQAQGYVVPGPVYVRPGFDPFQDALGRLRSRHDNSRRDGAVTLGRIGDPRAVPDLIWLLGQDNDAEVRTAAAFALGAIGDPNAAGALRQAAGSDRNRKVRQAATHAFGKITYAMRAAPVVPYVTTETVIAPPPVVLEPIAPRPSAPIGVEEFVPPPPSPFAPGPRLEAPRGAW